MHIAIVVAGLPPEVLGGAETQAARTAALLAARHRVTVLSRSRVRPRAWADGSPILLPRPRLRVPALRFVADVFVSVFALCRLRREIDVLIAYQTVIDGLIAVLAGRICRLPVLVWVRSEAEFRPDSVQSRWLSPWVYRHAAAIAVQTPALREALLGEAARHDSRRAGALAAKLHVLGNGVTLPAEAPGQGRGALFIGRLTPDKGVAQLLAAVRLCPTVPLDIVGEGAQRTALQSAATGLTNVRFVGRVAPEHIPERIAACALLVLPSLRNEGLPNVVLEAMAAGRAVLATRHAGLPDLIEDGVSGVLVAPGDVEELAAALQRLMSDEPLRERLGAAARKRVTSHAWPTLVQSLETLLSRLMAGHA